MQGRISSRLFVQAQAHFRDPGQQFLMQVMPFAHAHEGQELGLTAVAQLVPRQLPRLLVVIVPQVEQGQKIGLLVAETAMLLVGGLLSVQRSLARILNRQRRDQDQHLAQAAFLPCRQQHPSQTRIDRQPGQLPTEFADTALLINCLQFEQQAEPIADLPRIGRIDEGKILRLAQLQRTHLQNHRCQMGAQDFRVGKGRAGLEILFRVQANADAGTDPTAATGALPGTGLGNVLHRQALDAAARTVAADARRTRIDHIADAGHGQRGFGNVGGQDDARPAMRLKHTVLLRRRQARIQRQNLGIGWMVLAQALGGLANLALAREKNQDIARPVPPQFIHRIEDRLLQVAIALVFVIGQQRPVAQLHRITAPRDLDDRRSVKMAREALRVDGRRGDDDFQFRPARPQTLEIAEQEVDVQAALVGLVDDQHFILIKLAVALGFGEQDAVGHQLDHRIRPDPVGKAHLVANLAADRGAQFGGDARRHGAGRDAARLGMANQAGRTQPQ